jgi:hypothetical protein
LHPISQAEAGTAGEQPASNNLSSENEIEVGQNPTTFNQIQFLAMPKKIHVFFTLLSD